MRQRKLYLVATFHTTADAMAMEKACKNAKLPGKLISAPRDVSADCGIAWRTDTDLKVSLLSLIEEVGLETAGIHEILM